MQTLSCSTWEQSQLHVARNALSLSDNHFYGIFERKFFNLFTIRFANIKSGCFKLYYIVFHNTTTLYFLSVSTLIFNESTSAYS